MEPCGTPHVRVAGGDLKSPGLAECFGAVKAQTGTSRKRLMINNRDMLLIAHKPPSPES